MNETGKFIQELRIQAGFTQKALADALHITDKAISKWERGICLPDVTLLPKLALILDTEVELLLSKSARQKKWVGLIDIHGCDFSQRVYDKPLVYYLLSHYLLLGIRHIYVITEEENGRFLESPVFQSFGFEFSFTFPKEHPVMILNHPWFLFGSNLTQLFQGAMLSERDITLVPQRQEPVFYFAQSTDVDCFALDQFYSTAQPKTIGRGMICLDMGDNDKILDVASFIRTYQQNTGLLIASLEEIAYRKGYLSAQQLIKMAKGLSYCNQLLDLCKPQVG